MSGVILSSKFCERVRKMEKITKNRSLTNDNLVSAARVSSLAMENAILAPKD
jgi:hypothetical protein